MDNKEIEKFFFQSRQELIQKRWRKMPKRHNQNPERISLQRDKKAQVIFTKVSHLCHEKRAFIANFIRCFVALKLCAYSLHDWNTKITTKVILNAGRYI